MNKKQNVARLRADLRAAFGTPASQKPGTDLQALRAALRGQELPPRALAKVRSIIVAEGEYGWISTQSIQSSGEARSIIVAEGEYGAKEVAAGLELVQESTGSRVVRVREVICARSEFPID